MPLSRNRIQRNTRRRPTQSKQTKQVRVRKTRGYKQRVITRCRKHCKSSRQKCIRTRGGCFKDSDSLSRAQKFLTRYLNKDSDSLSRAQKFVKRYLNLNKDSDSLSRAQKFLKRYLNPGQDAEVREIIRKNLKLAAEDDVINTEDQLDTYIRNKDTPEYLRTLLPKIIFRGVMKKRRTKDGIIDRTRHYEIFSNKYLVYYSQRLPIDTPANTSDNYIKRLSFVRGMRDLKRLKIDEDFKEDGLVRLVDNGDDGGDSQPEDPLTFYSGTSEQPYLDILTAIQSILAKFGIRNIKYFENVSVPPLLDITETNGDFKHTGNNRFELENAEKSLHYVFGFLPIEKCHNSPFHTFEFEVFKINCDSNTPHLAKLSIEFETGVYYSSFMTFITNITEESEFRFENLENIGCGNYGNVYKVRTDDCSQHFFALKRNTSDGEEMIEKEVSILKRLNGKPNRHIYVLYTYHIEPSSSYLVTELCEGGTLASYTKAVLDVYTDSLLRYKDSKRIITQVLNGLQHCHEIEVCHLDIKLENLMFADTNHTCVKIIDFGTGEMDECATQCYSIHNTPLYVSPELLSSETQHGELVNPYDGFKVDIWCTGTVCYRLLTGVFPFPSEVHSTRRLQRYSKIIEADYCDKHLVTDNSKEFIKGMLCTSITRASASECLHHPWITS